MIISSTVVRSYGLWLAAFNITSSKGNDSGIHTVVIRFGVLSGVMQSEEGLALQGLVANTAEVLMIT